MPAPLYSDGIRYTQGHTIPVRLDGVLVEVFLWKNTLELK